MIFFFFKQKTAYEIVSRDWSSDVCSSDLNWSMDEMLSTYIKEKQAMKILVLMNCTDQRYMFKIGRASCRERV